MPDCLGETHWQFTPVLGTCKHDQDYMDRWATWPTGTLHLSTSHIQVVTQTEKAKYWFKECCCSRKPSQSDTRKKNYGKLCLLFTGFVVCLNIHITSVITGYSLKKNNCKNKSTDVHIFPSFKVILIIDLHVSLHNLKITYLLVWVLWHPNQDIELHSSFAE